MSHFDWLKLSHGFDRATKEDLEQVISFLPKEVETWIIGSSRLLQDGTRLTSGDIDIAVPKDRWDIIKTVESYSLANKPRAGLGIDSFAVSLDNGKLIQVDLMMSSNMEWSKWFYYTDPNSKYSGAIRNTLLFACLFCTVKPGKDILIFDSAQVFAKTNRVISGLDGLHRTFRIPTFNKKTNRFNSTAKAVSAKEFANHLKKIGVEQNFSKTLDRSYDPLDVSRLIFDGDDLLLSAESIIARLKDHPNARKIAAAAKIRLDDARLPIPAELDPYVL